MAKRIKFGLGDVNWPMRPRPITAMFKKTKEVNRFLRLELPKSPRRMSRGDVPLAQPWKVWEEEEY